MALGRARDKMRWLNTKHKVIGIYFEWQSEKGDKAVRHKAIVHTGIPEHKFSDQTVFQNTATSSTEVKKKKKEKKIRSTKSQYSYTTKTTY